MRKSVVALLLSVVTLFSACAGFGSATNQNGNNSSQVDSTASSSEQNSVNTNSSSEQNSANANSSSSDGNSSSNKENVTHKDDDNDEYCDDCGDSVVEFFDFYAVNDLHGKFADTEDQPGVDELSTYIPTARENNENTVVLSSGDMWQGSAESNLTQGKIVTDWMSEMDFVGMTLGNH